MGLSMKLYSLAFLLSGSLIVPLSQGNAFSLFNKSPTNVDQLKLQIKADIKSLSTLRELSRLSRQMEAVYLQAKEIGLNPETKKKVEDALKKEYESAQEDLFKVKTEWVKSRQMSLQTLQNKKSLKIAQIDQLNSDFKELDTTLNDLLTILESLPSEGQILLLFTLNFSSSFLPQDNQKQQMYDGLTKLKNKIIRAKKQLETLNKGIARLDLILQNVESDSKFIKALGTTLSRLAQAQRNLTNISNAYDKAIQPLLNPLSQKSQTLITSFEEKAKSLGCSALSRIGDGQRGITRCREQSLKRINDAAKKIKSKSCQLSMQSDDPTIEACAKEFGLSYLNLTQK